MARPLKLTLISMRLLTVEFCAWNASRREHFHFEVALKWLTAAGPRKTLIKEPSGNAQLFRLARRDLFLKQEWTLPSSTVSKKVKQVRQAE
ncbi:hypothetical protein KL86DES1_20545 [uncultured Desulfovibrio sp.]|uniref:Uncharacterized protein n=1 Tax=uncultured Desulfovibrio sp. TaxID=167968 RepID=A0A212L447_9BACT|nr:hypothetical protein KL86DES1_20545 [uncultured Desulfovibrio sp.]VZH33449.1 conserved protein of unknown function [Desulfovibrio sp. 86]